MTRFLRFIIQYIEEGDKDDNVGPARDNGIIYLPDNSWRQLQSGNCEMVPVEEEIDLHRLTVDEALTKLDDFLYAAFRAGLYRVLVVHGKGSGVLRQEVGRYLSKHPLVKTHGPADRYHGGIGATEVELSE